MADVIANDSVVDDVKNLLESLIDRIHLIDSFGDGISIKLEPRHHEKIKTSQHRSTTSKQKKKRRIFSSSEDDSSSSSDESAISQGYKTLINEDSDDEDEQKALHNRQGPRTRNELAIDELPPIENLTITLSEETPIERIGHIRHIIDGKLVIVESLLHSPPLNDDSVLFNRHRRSIGLIFETFGPVEQPYYSIRYNDIDSIHQRQLELNEEVFYAPKETTYTKYVFVQELKALKGSDASWEDDNEPPKSAIDYSDDEQERAAKAALKGKRNLDEQQMMETTDDDMQSVASNYSNFGRGRGRGRGRQQQQRGFRHEQVPNRPAPSLPNWFQNTSNTTFNPSRSTTTTQPSLWQNNANSLNSPTNVAQSDHQNANVRPVQSSLQGNTSTHSVFPWM